jgi:PAS domain S-box-containing protein
MDSDKKWIDFVLTNIELRDNREQLKEVDLKIQQQEQLLRDAQAELENRTQELTTNNEKLETFRGEVATRSRLLEDLEEQLTERQMFLVEKTQQVETFQTELALRDNELKTRMRELEEKQVNVDSLQAEVVSRNQIIDDIRRQLTENQTGLLEKTLRAEQLRDTVEQEQHLAIETETELVRKNDELSTSRREVEQKDGEIHRLQAELERNHEDLHMLSRKFQQTYKQLNVVTTEMKATESELQKKQGEIEQKEQSLNSLKQNFDTIQQESKVRIEELETITRELQERTTEIDLVKRDLKERLDQLDKKTVELNQIRIERDNLHFVFDHMENSIPSSVIIVNNENIITTWNKKAEGLFGVPSTSAIGMNISQVDLMGKERVREGFEQCKKMKEPVTIHSVSLKGDSENRVLTNVTQIPLVNDIGEFQGMMLVIDDVTDFAGLQADLQIKQQEMTDLTKRFQEMPNKLKITTIQKEPAIEVLESQSSEKENPLFILKDDQSMIQSEKKSLAGDIDHFIEKTEEHTGQLHDEITWKNELRICNEIEKCLDHASDDHLKTKKLKDEESK